MGTVRRTWEQVTNLWRRPPDAGESGPAAMEAREITFGFNGTPILDGVSVRIEPGKIIGVIGPNGAGKSTLVRLLSRALAPASGEVRLNGLGVDHWRPADLARVLAVVPQDPDLPPGFTAWEMVLMGRSPYIGWTGNESEHDRAIVRWAMDATRIEHLAQRSVDQLSGGEKQRVIVARALAQQPRVLLLDEPTSHLDINHQVDTLGLVRRLVRESGLAALAIFHDLNLAAQYCDRLVLLNGGRVAAEGLPEDVLTPDLLAQVYQTAVMVVPHPANGLPLALPLCASAD